MKTYEVIEYKGKLYEKIAYCFFNNGKVVVSVKK